MAALTRPAASRPERPPSLPRVSASPSPFAWPILTAVSAVYLPLVAALHARRPLWADPVGRIALGWALLGALDLWGLAHYLHLLPRSDVVNTLALPLAVVLFAPPLLALIGSRARRLAPALVGSALVLFAVAVALLGTARELRLVVSPVVDGVVALLALAALAAVARRAPGDPVRDGRVWVCAGTAEYFLLGVVWRPLSEALVARHWGTLIDLHMGMMLVHTIAYLLIAWGTLRHDDVVVSPVPAAIPGAA